MRKSEVASFWSVVAVCALALAASATLFVDYVRPAPVFCGLDGGCGAMKRTVFAYPLGVPMPVFGIAGFLAIAAFSLVPTQRARRLQAMLSVFAAIVATGLLVVQAMMKTLCPYCAVVDVAALVVAGLSVTRALREHATPERRAPMGIAIGAVLVAIAAPMLVGFSKKGYPADLPRAVAEEIEKSPRGVITVVDFVDFECPFCRMTHAELAPLLAERKVRVARKHVPLRMHVHAFDAARAACCAEKLGKGEAYAEALFTTPPDELTPEGCEKLAKEQGLDAARFRECVVDPATDARIKADTQVFRDAKGHGLPTLFVGTHRLEGAQDHESLRAALDQAAKEL